MTKVMKKAQKGDNVSKDGRVKDSFLAKLVSKRSKLDDYKDAAANFLSKKTGIAQSAPKEKKAMKSGGMLKRADGSYSKRGLWDNIRANKGSGKKPTAQMLKQEKKIKAKTK